MQIVHEICGRMRLRAESPHDGRLAPAFAAALPTGRVPGGDVGVVDNPPAGATFPRLAHAGDTSKGRVRLAGDVGLGRHGCRLRRRGGACNKQVCGRGFR